MPQEGGFLRTRHQIYWYRIDDVVIPDLFTAATRARPFGSGAANSAEFETVPQRRREPRKCGEGIGFAFRGEAMAVC